MQLDILLENPHNKGVSMSVSPLPSLNPTTTPHSKINFLKKLLHLFETQYRISIGTCHIFM